MKPTNNAKQSRLDMLPVSRYRLRVFAQWVSENNKYIAYSMLRATIIKNRFVPDSYEKLFASLVFKSMPIKCMTSYISIKELKSLEGLVFLLINTLGLVDNYTQTSAHLCSSDARAPLIMRLIVDTCKYNRHVGMLVKLSETFDRDAYLALLFFSLNACGLYPNTFTLDSFLSPPPVRFALKDPQTLLKILPHFSPSGLQLQKDLSWTAMVEGFYNTTVYNRINDRITYMIKRVDVTNPPYVVKFACGTHYTSFYVQTDRSVEYVLADSSGRTLFKGTNHPNLPCSCSWADTENELGFVDLVFDNKIIFPRVDVYAANPVVESDTDINITTLADTFLLMLDISQLEKIKLIKLTSHIRQQQSSVEYSPTLSLLNNV